MRVCAIVASYNRYEWLQSIIRELYKYNDIRIFICNDCSTDERYGSLRSDGRITYLKTPQNGGKKMYYKTITSLLRACQPYNPDYVIQVDDDFQLCDYFVDRILHEFNRIKLKDDKYTAIHYHHNVSDRTISRWQFGANWLDGGIVLDNRILKIMRWCIPPPRSNWFHDPNMSSGAWYRLSQKINNRNLKIYKTKYSYALHLGISDSVMHTDFRKLHNIHTDNFIDVHNSNT